MDRDVQNVSSQGLLEQLDSFVELLTDAVDSGASVGFLTPMTPDENRAYWLRVADALKSGQRFLLAAQDAGGVAGSVQVEFPAMPNAAHRAEVMKLLVHRRTRRQGLGRSLMLAAEELARAHGRSLLVLDTRKGDAAEQLYRSIGYAVGGVIPRYARSSSGTLDDTVYLFKELGAVS